MRAIGTFVLIVMALAVGGLLIAFLPILAVVLAVALLALVLVPFLGGLIKGLL